MESHLGEVIGSVESMKPIKVVRRNPRWIEDGTSLLIAWIATAIFAPLGALALWIAFHFAGRGHP